MLNNTNVMFQKFIFSARTSASFALKSMLNNTNITLRLYVAPQIHSKNISNRYTKGTAAGRFWSASHTGQFWITTSFIRWCLGWLTSYADATLRNKAVTKMEIDHRFISDLILYVSLW